MLKSHSKTIKQILGRETVHPFPARMAPGIALEIIASSPRPMKILDPMMGSGTVLAVAKAHGHAVYGVDIDPLAVLISKVWTTPVDVDDAISKAELVLIRAKVVFKRTPSKNAYPKSADRETREFIDYWFDPLAKRQLYALSDTICRLKESDTKSLLWCAFSRLIISKSAGASRAMDLSHSRPHRSFDVAPILPFDKFMDNVTKIAESCSKSNFPKGSPRSRIKLGDARALPIKSESIDLVLTSPPYLNAIDYIRCSKFSLVWMGELTGQLRDIRRRSVGAELKGDLRELSDSAQATLMSMKLHDKLSPRKFGMLIRYVADLDRAIAEVARVLNKDGVAVYVIGENSIRDVFIKNAKLITALAKASGLKLVSRRTRIIPASRRYMPPPSGAQAVSMNMASRMGREVVLAFRHG